MLQAVELRPPVVANSARNGISVIHELRPAKAPRSSSDSKIPTSTPSTHGAVNTPDQMRSGSSCASVSRRPDRAKNRPSARDAQDGRGLSGWPFATPPLDHEQGFRCCSISRSAAAPSPARREISGHAGRGSVPVAPHVLIAELGACADASSCHLFLRLVPGENLIENNGAERGGADTAHGEVAELERRAARRSRHAAWPDPGCSLIPGLWSSSP